MVNHNMSVCQPSNAAHISENFWKIWSFQKLNKRKMYDCFKQIKKKK